MLKIVFDEELVDYRALEIQEGVYVLRELEKGTKSPEFYLGAMHMLKRIVQLPAKMVSKEDKQQVALARDLQTKALIQFEKLMMRELLADDPSTREKG